MIAALLRRCVVRCRSKQFSDRFNFPPMNHFANGAFHSKTFRQRFCHKSSPASRAQNLSGFLIDSRYIRRSEEHTSELQSQSNLVCRLLLEKKKNTHTSCVPCPHVRHTRSCQNLRLICSVRKSAH